MNFAAFDLNLLRVFDALMRERSATRAGEMIGLSQPAVSNALGRIRQSLADELFVRRGNDMVPTPRAEELAEPIREALAQIEQAVGNDAVFDPATAERTFTLFGADFFSFLTIPPLYERIEKAAPGIRLRVLDSAFGDVAALLRDSAIDIALERGLATPEWVSSELLFHSQLAVVAARGHPVLKEAGVRPGDRLPMDLFCALPHALRSIDGSMSGMVDDALAKAGKSRRVVLTLPQFNSVAFAVAQSRLVATVPTQTAAQATGELALDIYQTPIEVPPRDLRMYWHRRQDRNPAHRWLRGEILATLAPVREESEKAVAPAG